MNHMFDPNDENWAAQQKLESLAFTCGHCNNHVASSSGYKLGVHRDGSGQQLGGIYICTHCMCPTIRFPNGEHIPDVAFGSAVRHVPDELNELYDEARRCTSNGGYTAAVLLCRKMLMHIGVQQGADEGKNFLHYVDHLADNGFVPPNGRQWVDHIRKIGNEANHEIRLMERDQANDLISFIEMLLKFIYEFPNRVPQANAV